MLESDLNPQGDDARPDARGNRPAANAKVSSSTDATMGSIDGQSEAEDFLGLEGEVQFTDEPNPGDGGPGYADDFGDGSEGGGLSEGWLLEVADPGQPVQSYAAGHAPAAGDGGWAAEDDGFGPEHSGEVDENGEPYAEEGYPEEGYAEDGYAEEGYEEGQDEHAPRSSPVKKLALIGTAAALVGATALFFLREETSLESPGELAARVEPRKGAPAPVAPSQGAEAEPQPTGAETRPAFEDVPEDETLDVLDGLLAGGDEAPAPFDPGLQPAPIQIPDVPLSEEPEDFFAGLPPRTAAPTVMERIGAAMEEGDITDFMDFDLAESGLIWTGEQVPFEAIQKPGRLLTPGVGAVRTTMASGELFEGNLYGVGSNRVWMEIGPGRIGLDGERVASIERLVAPPNGTTAEGAPGERVRVRTAGGVLYGHVKSRDGNRVTLVTDKGGRITLVDPVIEPIGRLSGLVLNP